ncbi:MAG: polyprenyl synthetase family protein [Chlamydiae bacterium]|nr:polyprenyl synthetase family protein [Chlamydiota bacterium]
MLKDIFDKSGVTMSFFQSSSFLSKKLMIEQALNQFIQSDREDHKLKEAVAYSLNNGGKRIRPIIVLMIAEALKCPYSILEAAISVECFHTASLIADDLPMMDNDLMRRGCPSLHVQFGQTVALLASYGLIALSFEKIHDCAKEIVAFDSTLEPFASKVCMIALKEASFAAGLKGTTLGQYFDLFPKEGCSIDKLTYLKTVTLFEVSFLFGWLFSSGDFSKIDQVKKLSYHFGIAYQIADDLQDDESDLEKGKTYNFSLIYGKENAWDLFSFHLDEVKKNLESLNLFTEDFQKLVVFLENYGALNKKSPSNKLKTTFAQVD